jgi:YD repeat-containing protein
MPTEGEVRLPVDGIGKRLRMAEVTVEGVPREQQVATLASADGELIGGTAEHGLDVDVTRMPPIVVSNLPATQPVSGPLTDAQLRAAAVPVTVGNFPAVQDVAVTTPLDETRLDYGARTDGNPEFVASAPQGSATSAAVWRVLKLEYDGSARLTRKQIRDNITWDGRASGWS